MESVFRQETIPEVIHALGALAEPYYVDVFTATADDARATSPEDWARAVLDRANPVGRFLAWRAILNLRLESRPSADVVAGWRIAERGEDWVRLEASSWFLTARIVFFVEEAQVSMATFVKNNRLLTTPVWPAASMIHRAAMPGLMRSAAKRIVQSR